MALTALPLEVQQLVSSQKMRCEQTPHDFLLTGVLDYVYKDTTYGAPVQIFVSKIPAPHQDEQPYRSRINLDEARSLNMVVSNLASYIDLETGAIRLDSPTVLDTLVSYVTKLSNLFSQRPPLTQLANQTKSIVRTPEVPQNLWKAFERSIQKDIAIFARGKAFRYDREHRLLKGVIPITKDGETYCIPLRIEFSDEVAMLSGSRWLRNPNVKVTPISGMALVASARVNPAGIVNCPVLNEWPSVFREKIVSQWPKEGGPVLLLLEELSKIFSETPPVRSRPVFTAPPNSKGPLATRLPSLHKVEDTSGKEESNLCVICLEKEKRCLFLPCRHVALCKDCAATFRAHEETCPLCRNKYVDIIEIFM